MSLTEIFISAACAFLGFFIVFSMIGAKEADRESNKDRDGNQKQQDEAKSEYCEIPPQWPSVLGVSQSASEDHVKMAYRSLIQKYHPDKLTNLGEEFQAMAEARTKEINEAYEAYKRSTTR
jgi:DnaJ-domain-containing protein 1